MNIAYLRRNRELYEATDDYWEMLNNFKPEGVNRGFPNNYPFKTEPRPHQLTAIKKLYPFDASAIYADIGTGKSKMAIDMAACRYYEGSIQKVLVIALMSLKHNWEEEVNKHCPINSSIHGLQTSKAGKNRFYRFMEEDGFQWLVVGVESLSAGAAFGLCEQFVDSETMIIIDESDSIKTPGKIRTERCIELGKTAAKRVIMTGTPIEQGIIDLYSQFEFLDPNIVGIGDFYSFRNRYAIMGGYNDKAIIGYQQVDELLEAVGPRIYQVRKRDVLDDLPEATYYERRVPMSAEQKALYSTLKKNLTMEHEGNRLTVNSSINLMQRFAEITGGFYSYIDTEVMDEISIDEKAKIKYKKAYLKSNPKAKELMAFIGSLPHGEPVIVWAVSKMEVAYIVSILSDAYGKESVVQMHGGIKEKDRIMGLKRFEAREAQFLVGNQAVGGVGLNMTVAAIMVYFSNDFSLRRRIQSEGRIERIGQKRAMSYVDIICEASIDGYIAKALKNKNDFAEEIRSAFDSGRLEDLI